MMARTRVCALPGRPGMEKSGMTAASCESGSRLLLALFAGLACAAGGHAQALLPGLSLGARMRLPQADLAVLELQEPRRDLSCTVTTAKPDLGFDFMFHAGYEIKVPLRELAGDGNLLSILFRVVPEDRPDQPSYMEQKVTVPAIEEHGNGEGKLHGVFALGEGKYHIDWLMRDQRERVCAMSWNLEAKLNADDSRLRQWVPQALVQEPARLFAEEPWIIREPGANLPRVSIIVNVDPPSPSAVVLDDLGLQGLVAALTRIERDPRVEIDSVIVCSLENQQVVYSQENNSRIDLPALGEALQSLQLGRIDAKHLLSSSGAVRFAADLIREQLARKRPAALVVLGPKRGREMGGSREALQSFDLLDKPVFYLSYGDDRQASVLRDPISSMVKRLRGLEYKIDRPKDLFYAWSDVVARILQARQVAVTPTVTSAAAR